MSVNNLDLSDNLPHPPPPLDIPLSQNPTNANVSLPPNPLQNDFDPSQFGDLLKDLKNKSPKVPTLTQRERKKIRTPTKEQQMALKHLDCMDRWAVKVFSIIALLALVLAAVLVMLAIADKVHPLASLCALSASIIFCGLTQGIDCCQRCIAEKNGLSLQAYYAVRQPLPDAEEESSDKKPLKPNNKKQT